MHPLPPARAKLLASLSGTNPFRGPYALERDWGAPIRLRLGANESPYGPSAVASSTCSDAISVVARYCDPLNHDLRGVLAQRHGITPDQIVVGQGVDGLLGEAARCFLNPGDIAVTTAGSYPTFGYHALGYGGEVREVSYTEDFFLDLDRLVDLANQVEARILYLANPDNPSGTYLSEETVMAAVSRLHSGCAVFLDEAYLEFAPGVRLWTGVAPDARVIRFRSFSKAYGLAGLRVGYAMAHPDVIADFQKIRLHYGVTSVSQAAAMAAVCDDRHLENVLRGNAEARARLTKSARELGFAVLPSATNFVTIDFGSAERSAQVFGRLNQERVFTYRPARAPLERCVRVSVGSIDECSQFEEALKRAVGSMEHHTGLR